MAKKAPPAPAQPLADQLRPQNLGEVAGQDHVLKGTGAIARMVKAGRPGSVILWGPPGCGKTTIARLLASEFSYHFEALSAVFSGVADLRKVFESAEIRRNNGVPTLLFVDEIHRFNRTQQDAFLPYVEKGTITLIGATTENPSFELNPALMSRCQLVVLKRLDDAALEHLIERAETLLDKKLPLTDEARQTLITLADGDGRYLFNMIESIADESDLLDTQQLLTRIQKRAPIYDKAQESHYNLISALHKSVRGSDADAALYWMARMMVGGEDPLYIARRMIRMAVEDIGLADPNALQVALNGWDTFERLGSPEGELALANVITYLATAPKSNAAYMAFKAAQRMARDTGSLMPPAHILNAPTKLMKNIGYGKGYNYDHDAEDAFSGQNYFPDDIERPILYQPVERGFEREIKKRLEYWAKLRATRRTN